MAAARQGRYTATLTPDARGPVSASADGNTFHIHYRMGRFTTMDQTLRCAPAGRSRTTSARCACSGSRSRE